MVSECFIYSYCYLLQLADECEERQEKEPLVVVLDSMGGQQDAAVNDILEYLTDEWTKNTFIDKSTAAFPFDRTEMAIITPKCPKQPNYTSCGLYLIQFMSKIFQDIGRYCTSKGYKNIQNWTNDEEMKQKRSEIATLIQIVSKEQGRYDHLTFPDVKFFQNRTHSNNSDSSQKNEDLAYFNAYAKSEAEKQRDFSLCRQYNWQLSVSRDRYRQLIVMLREFEHKKAVQCFEIRLFKEYLEVNRDEHPYTDKEMMCCLKQMEEDAIIMVDKNKIYCL